MLIMSKKRNSNLRGASLPFQCIFDSPVGEQPLVEEAAAPCTLEGELVQVQVLSWEAAPGAAAKMLTAKVACNYWALAPHALGSWA